MAVTTPSSPSAGSAQPEGNGALPPLANGDRLTRAELERRYDAMPAHKNAELIEGEVYIPSPVRHEAHGHPHTRLIAWLADYETDTPGVEGGDNGSIRLDVDNEPQPDAFLIIRPEYRGQARISEDDYIEGAPELVAEVASSSVSYDLGKKFHVYRRTGTKVPATSPQPLLPSHFSPVVSGEESGQWAGGSGRGAGGNGRGGGRSLQRAPAPEAIALFTILFRVASRVLAMSSVDPQPSAPNEKRNSVL